MKTKIILLFLIIITLSSCKNNNILLNKNIETIIEENNPNYLISINYPSTNIKKLDTILKKEIDDTIKLFKKEYVDYNNKEKSELNIDYTYSLINERYINVTLTIFINKPYLAHPITYLKTYVFDIKTNKLLTINDLTNDNLSTILEQQLKNKYKDCILEEKINLNKDTLFTFSDTILTIYFNPYILTSGYCGIIKLQIPLTNINLKIPISLDEEETNTTINIANEKNIIDINKPVVALTFDDGPSKYTDEILELLKKYNINATFFVLGNKVKHYSETIKKTLELGNEIGNHSYNHKQLTKLSIIELQEQINKTQDIIKEITGYTPKLLRPTYGEINNTIRENTNLKIVLWNVDSLDWKKKNSNDIASSVIKNTKNGSIILMHDTKKRTIEALEIIIPKLLEKEYQFVTISELEEVNLLKQN